MSYIKHDTVPVINENILKFMMLELSMFFLIAIYTLCTRQPSFHVSLKSLELTIRPSDSVFTAGMLILVIELYNFYKKVICVTGEGVIDSLISVFGMIYLMAISIFTFIDRFFVFRFLFLFILALAVLFKNYKLQCQLNTSKLGLRFIRWRNQAAYTCAVTGISAVLFFVCYEPQYNKVLLELFVEGDKKSFSSFYYDVAPAVFYSLFLVHVIRLYYVDTNYFASKDFTIELNEVTEQ